MTFLSNHQSLHYAFDRRVDLQKSHDCDEPLLDRLQQARTRCLLDRKKDRRAEAQIRRAGHGNRTRTNSGESSE